MIRPSSPPVPLPEWWGRGMEDLDSFVWSKDNTENSHPPEVVVSVVSDEETCNQCSIPITSVSNSISMKLECDYLLV